MQFSTTLIAAVAALSSTVAAHPGHDARQEIAERRAFMATHKRDLSHCAEKLKARGIEARNVARRAATATRQRERRGLVTRDFATVLNTTHLSDVDYTPETDETIVFSSNNSCILSPEVTQGPYYVSGEYYRKNLTETQPGVPMILDTQVIDMDTCEPVDYAFVEIWGKFAFNAFCDSIEWILKISRGQLYRCLLRNRDQRQR
jgi:hypothetical protein